MSNSELKTLQFELWQECNNDCSFCYLGSDNRVTPKQIKMDSLNRVLNTISDESNYDEYQCIGYIGGEFFQGQLKDPDVRELFFTLMRKTAELYNNQTIQQVWISATLTIGHQEDLYETLKLFNNWNNIWIITSWDTIGRFKTQKMKDTWDFHMRNLKKEFPNIKINICTILTEDLINRYLAKEFTFKSMAEEYQAMFFFKQCGCMNNNSSMTTIEEQMIAKINSNQIVPYFFPHRSKFIRFLSKVKQNEPKDIWNRMLNIHYRADNVVRTFNDGSIFVLERDKNSKGEVNDSPPMKCGHPLVYCAYIDSDKCCLCDKISLSDD